MRHRGWLLDPYVEGAHAVLWLKTEDGEAVRIRDRFRPHFYAEPHEGFKAEDVAFLFEENPDVYSTWITERFGDLRRKCLKRVVKVTVDSVRELNSVISVARNLREVREIFNIGLAPIQWYLINRGIAPSSLVELEEESGTLLGMEALDDSANVEPLPFSALIFRTSESDTIEAIEVYDGDGSQVADLRGSEEKILREFQETISKFDPDIIAADKMTQASRRIMSRAASHALDFRFGRKGETLKGRILLDLRTLEGVGIAGLAERARFTFAPMGLSADWPAGKTIDSRQCYEANRLGILVPEMKGGFVTDAMLWSLMARDRGGMIFSPRVGLHENVGCLDFESMFPNIIVRRNVSYETVGPDIVDTETPGFMGGFTRSFLDRRLHFKHMRKRFPENSREWLWCEQRQLALKLVLVCIYGYSGCYANRFANVRVFQEINREARGVLVQSLNISLERGFEVVYGDTDSIFPKRPDATERDYEDLAAAIEEATGLPIKLDRHFKFLVLMPRASDPRMQAARRYFGKLTDGSLFYRGIELRRHDTPPFILRLQESMMRTLFDAEDSEKVVERQVPKVRRMLREACSEIKQGKVAIEDLVIEKRVSREPSEYRSNQAHVMAAKLGAIEDGNINFVFVNAEHRNPYLRVMPASMINGGHKNYDKAKYIQLLRRAADHLLKSVAPDEDEGGSSLRSSRLDTYF